MDEFAKLKQVKRLVYAKDQNGVLLNHVRYPLLQWPQLLGTLPGTELPLQWYTVYPTVHLSYKSPCTHGLIIPQGSVRATKPYVQGRKNHNNATQRLIGCKPRPIYSALPPPAIHTGQNCK